MPGKTEKIFSCQNRPLFLPHSGTMFCRQHAPKDCMSQWNSTFFAFSLIIEGTTRQALPFINATLVNFQQKPWFH
jgi:hypothetical protein